MRGQLKVLETVLMVMSITIVVGMAVGLVMREMRGMMESINLPALCPAAMFSSAMPEFSGPTLLSYRVYFDLPISDGDNWLPLDFEKPFTRLLFGRESKIIGGIREGEVICMFYSPVTGRPMWVVEA